jgi:hypothetical protein
MGVKYPTSKESAGEHAEYLKVINTPRKLTWNEPIHAISEGVLFAN